MKQIDVNAGKPYPVKIGRGLLPSCGAELKGIGLSGKVMIVTDDNVAPLYLKAVENSLKNSGFTAFSFTLPHGENSKNFDNLIKLLNFTAESGLTRSDTFIALGGGVVGDLCGFAAAVYMRGVHFVQCPTTLLAAVDSSVGGKTAVDLAAGKNLAGAFYQPDLVLCDLDTFATLPPEEYANGMAEVIKYGFIRDAQLLAVLEQAFDEEAVVALCVQIKADVVANDEFDRGERMLLNFGHTVGHAIEAVSGYTVPHGQAVALGMAAVTRACVKNGLCPPETLSILLRLLTRYGLPNETGRVVNELFGWMGKDKKASGDSITFVLPRETGRCELKRLTRAEWTALLS